MMIIIIIQFKKRRQRASQPAALLAYGRMSYKCQQFPTPTVATLIFVHSCHTYPQSFGSLNGY
jgi:hypothetical protein